MSIADWIALIVAANFLLLICSIMSGIVLIRCMFQAALPPPSRRVEGETHDAP